MLCKFNNIFSQSKKISIENTKKQRNILAPYIINRYTKFAFLAAVNDGADAVDALTGYIDAINAEIKRKREEFGLPVLETDEEPPIVAAS